MTTPTPPSDTTPHTPHDCVGHCVGTASETTPRAPSETTASDRPLPYGGRHSQRAPLTASATTASTASDTLTHWGSASARPTSLHGNGASSFESTTLDVDDVTCRLCLALLERSTEDCA